MLKTGDIVGEIECPSCGADVAVKVNKKGGLCAICTNVIAPEAAGNKKYCWHRQTFGRHAVHKFAENYQPQGESDNVRDQEQETTGNTEHNPQQRTDDNPERGVRSGSGEEVPEPAGAIAHKSTSGLFGGIKHFLTADD